jgi:hypothetical protein
MTGWRYSRIAHAISIVQYVFGEPVTVVDGPGLDSLEDHSLDVFDILACLVAGLQTHRAQKFAAIRRDRASDSCDRWRT